MNPTYRILFGQRLKKLRLERGLQQKTVAAGLHVNPSTYSNYENGVYLPGIETLIRLADLFDVSLDELTGRDDYPSDTASVLPSETNVSVPCKSVR